MQLFVLVEKSSIRNVRRLRVQDTSQESSPTTLFSLRDLHHHAILSTAQLRRWDFPVFELQRQLDTFMLSKVRLTLHSYSHECTARSDAALEQPRAHRGQARVARANLIETRRDSARH